MVGKGDAAGGMGAQESTPEDTIGPRSRSIRSVIEDILVDKGFEESENEADPSKQDDADSTISGDSVRGVIENSLNNKTGPSVKSNLSFKEAEPSKHNMALQNTSAAQVVNFLKKMEVDNSPPPPPSSPAQDTFHEGASESRSQRLPNHTGDEISNTRSCNSFWPVKGMIPTLEPTPNFLPSPATLRHGRARNGGRKSEIKPLRSLSEFRTGDMYPYDRPPNHPWGYGWVWDIGNHKNSFMNCWQRMPVRIPLGRFDDDAMATTVTRADGLPGKNVPYGHGAHYGTGNPPDRPWAWGWVWPARFQEWKLRPVWLPPVLEDGSVPAGGKHTQGRRK